MAAADIFGALFGKVDKIGTTMVQTLYSEFATALQPVFLAGVTVYVAWWGYEMLYGRAPMTAGTFIWRLGRIFLIYSLAFSWADFQPLIVDTLTIAPNSVATAVCKAAGSDACGDGAGSMSQGLTDIWNAAFTVSTKISEAGGWTGAALMCLSYILLIIVGLMLAVAVFLIMFGKMALFVLLATAPIWLAFALFQFTSPLTDGWMRALAQYAILPIIVYAMLGVMLIMLKTSVKDIQAQVINETAMTVVAPFLLMCAVTTFLLLQSTIIAQGIAGGARLETRTAAGAAMKTARATGFAVRGLYRLFTGKSGGGPSGKNNDPAAATIRSGVKEARA